MTYPPITAGYTKVSNGSTSDVQTSIPVEALERLGVEEGDTLQWFANDEKLIAVVDND